MKAPTTDHITPHFRTLHWLPIDARIKCKPCSLCFGTITATGPVWLSDLLQIYTFSERLRSSADSRILYSLSVNNNSELSSFYTAPTLRNTLQKDTRFSQSAKYLGVTLDMHLTMIAHIVNLIRTANFELCRINSIRHYLSVQATKTLVSAFDFPRLDYCNSLLSGCPQYLLNRLQKVQNNAARLILKALKTKQITPHLRTLHWLPIDARIKYKLCSLCFGAITSTGPAALSDLLKIYTPSRQLRSPADIRILCIPSLNTKSYGERCFSYTIPTL